MLVIIGVITGVGIYRRNKGRRLGLQRDLENASRLQARSEMRYTGPDGTVATGIQPGGGCQHCQCSHYQASQEARNAPSPPYPEPVSTNTLEPLRSVARAGSVSQSRTSSDPADTRSYVTHAGNTLPTMPNYRSGSNISPFPAMVPVTFQTPSSSTSPAATSIHYVNPSSTPRRPSNPPAAPLQTQTMRIARVTPLPRPSSSASRRPVADLLGGGDLVQPPPAMRRVQVPERVYAAGAMNSGPPPSYYAGEARA